MFVLLLLLICPPANDDGIAIVQLANGKQRAGRLSRFTSDGAQLRTPDGNTTVIGLDQIEAIRFEQELPEPPGTVQYVVQFTDGTTALAESCSIQNGALTIITSYATIVETTTRNVDWIRFTTPPLSPELVSDWNQMMDDAATDGDQLIVMRDAKLNAIDGILGDVSDDKVVFTIEDRTAEVPRSRLSGLRFYHAKKPDLSTPICQLVCRDGSEWNLAKCNFHEKEILAETPAGVSLQLPTGAIQQINVGTSRTIQLTELEPATSDWRPWLNTGVHADLVSLRRPRMNQNYKGEPLELRFHEDPGIGSMRREQFDSGLAMAAGGRISYSLDGQYRRMQGWIGFDPDSSFPESVRVVIRADNREIFSQTIQKRPEQNPVSLDLDLTNVQRLLITADYVQGPPVGNIVYLCDLKISK